MTNLKSEQLAFYVEHCASVRRMIRRRVAADDRADVENKTWEDFFRHWDRNTSGRKPVGVLMTIAKRRAVDWHRLRTSANPAACVGEEALHRFVEDLSRDQSADRIGDAASVKVDLEAALAELTPEHSEPLRLLYFECLDPDTAAARLGIKRSTLYKRAKEAKKILAGSPHLAAEREDRWLNAAAFAFLGLLALGVVVGGPRVLEALAGGPPLSDVELAMTTGLAAVRQLVDYLRTAEGRRYSSAGMPDARNHASKKPRRF